MMKRIQAILVVCFVLVARASAGGLMTNTNYHIAFDRMMARGATFDVDAAYSNPAGSVWNQHEGWLLSLNFQKPWQNRDIETNMPNFLGSSFSKKYEGVAKAPIVPSLLAAYKKDRWAISGMLGIVGCGGYVEYSDGIPMLNVPLTAMLASSGVMPRSYTLDSEMKGKQYIFGAQVNFAYRITDFLSAAAGLRVNYYDGYNRGHVIANNGQLDLVNLQLDCLQKGWGISPIVSIDFHTGPVTIAARYEFRSRLNTENDTKQLNAKIFSTAINNYVTGDMALAQFGDKVAPYKDGVDTRYDVPAMLAVAVGYEFSDKLRATAEYHFYDDKHAKMGNNRHEELTGGTNEFLLGAEYDINDKFTVSLGGQRTDYGQSDKFQTNTSFACDSWSIGLGGAVNLTEKIRLNAGYFITLYSNYDKSFAAGNPAAGEGYYGTGFEAKETYSRTNNVVGVGIDFKF